MPVTDSSWISEAILLEWISLRDTKPWGSFEAPIHWPSYKMVVSTEVLFHPQVVLDEIGFIPSSCVLSTEHNAHNDEFITDQIHQHTDVSCLHLKSSVFPSSSFGVMLWHFSSTLATGVYFNPLLKAATQPSPEMFTVATSQVKGKNALDSLCIPDPFVDDQFKMKHSHFLEERSTLLQFYRGGEQRKHVEIQR